MSLLPPITSHRPTAVVLHGVGSTADFARRCLAGPIDAAGYDVLAPVLRGHSGTIPLADPTQHSVDLHVADLAALATEVDVDLVAGISLGAEIALRWACSTGGEGLHGLLLCLPGISGPASAPAAANRAAATELATYGVAAVLDRIAASAGALPWVVEEVRAAWPQLDPASLVAALRAVAAAEPMADAALRLLDVPVGIVAVTDDAGHPVELAARWASALPRAVVVTVRLADLGRNRSILGRSALRALALARHRPEQDSVG